MKHVKLFENFKDEDFEDFNKKLEFIFLDKKYKSPRTGESNIGPVPANCVGRTFFPENAVGYQYEVKILDETGNVKYRMIYPFHEPPLKESFYKNIDEFEKFCAKWGTKAKDAILKFAEHLNKEMKETGTAISFIEKYLRGEKLTTEEHEAVKQQFYDILKLLGVVVPFTLIPGASVLLPVLIKIAEHNGIELMPSAFNAK